MSGYRLEPCEAKAARGWVVGPRRARVALGVALVSLMAIAVARSDTPAAKGHRVSEWRDRSGALARGGNLPHAGEDCAAIYYPPRHSLVVYGGKGDDDRNLNEIWEYDLDRDAWQPIAAAGASPEPTEDHSLIYDPVGDRLVLFGGENGPTGNQLWSFGFANRTWRSLSDSTTPRREDHTAIYDARGKRMVTFGGWAGENVNYYDVRALDLDPGSKTFETWRDLTVEKNHPLGRSDHAAIYDSLRNRMVIFGGWDKDQKAYLGDTWAFTLPASPESAGVWKAMKTRHSHPPARRHAVGVYDARHNWFLICGGYADEGYLNDVWAFDLTDDVWINVTPGPQPRIDHQAVFDPKSGRMVLYGGDARLDGKFHDLWELEVAPDAPIGAMLKNASGKNKAAPRP